MRIKQRKSLATGLVSLNDSITEELTYLFTFKGSEVGNAKKALFIIIF